ncbi:hypothetical protein [Microbacterium marinilacus]|uniref:hypothetical protein n=1 Tax=Microbacterium marinilacus TaxID=415209 RepID=UPI001C8E5CEF|nr:hypothetical protein [Microbacterium marinilacus]MBY0688738.1 hypothetical protein [Microbacterium marinilacus]
MNSSPGNPLDLLLRGRNQAIDALGAALTEAKEVDERITDACAQGATADELAATLGVTASVARELAAGTTTFSSFLLNSAIADSLPDRSARARRTAAFRAADRSDPTQ